MAHHQEEKEEESDMERARRFHPDSPCGKLEAALSDYYAALLGPSPVWEGMRADNLPGGVNETSLGTR